jgi:hypothetical protein
MLGRCSPDFMVLLELSLERGRPGQRDRMRWEAGEVSGHRAGDDL